MDKHLNKIESRIQELLGSKAFSELNADEKSFIQQHLTQEEYQLQRDIILESSMIYDDKKLVAPPLILTKNSKSFWFKSFPMYQTGIAVAATVILMFFLKFPGKETIKTETEIKYVSQVDTLIQTEYIHDTVIEVIEKPFIVEKTTYIEVPGAPINNTATNEEDPSRTLNPSGPYPIPTFGVTNTSSSSSFANDETAVLVPEMILTD